MNSHLPFDHARNYRAELLRIERASQIQSIALSCIAGLALGMIGVVCWMLSAG